MGCSFIGWTRGETWELPFLFKFVWAVKGISNNTCIYSTPIVYSNGHPKSCCPFTIYSLCIEHITTIWQSTTRTKTNSRFPDISGRQKWKWIGWTLQYFLVLAIIFMTKRFLRKKRNTWAGHRIATQSVYFKYIKSEMEIGVRTGWAWKYSIMYYAMRSDAMLSHTPFVFSPLHLTCTPACLWRRKFPYKS